MVEEKIVELKNRLDNQIINNEEYEKIYKTSTAIDKLIIEYYNQYGLTGVK
ncbi:MAG: Spo0E family sporulation regulatory protein-aspartic acid phosphatase [Clostridia bacterium]|nr:Spo0E family sporulation regulatory protein-aspartic acid phosphatase [Clostridia bacterium]MDD4386313.1 Spo0E family sporulation regulatory protein-aspartic acid phosphatase [Clostridia bacterium]